MRARSFYAYCALSAVAAALLVCYAAYTREQFYPTIQFLVTSKLSLAILGNLVLCYAITFARLAKVLFLDTLRDIEVELIYENSKYALTETCLALTLFRAEISIGVVAMFGALLFCKIFHWLAKSRVEHLEQVVAISRSTHFRLLSLMVILFAIDVSVVYGCALDLITRGRSVLILFGFEYAILTISMLSYLLKYLLYAIDTASESTWHEKGAFVMLVDLVKEGLCFAVYAAFFALMFIYYGIPLHVVRDVYLSYMSFHHKLSNYFRYRQLTANLDERFPDATPEEVERADHTCIICREPMDGGKKIACDHVFHLNCLRMWLQHQQTCPVCRADIPSNPVPSRRNVHPPHARPQRVPLGAGDVPGAAAPHDVGAQRQPEQPRVYLPERPRPHRGDLPVPALHQRPRAPTPPPTLGARRLPVRPSQAHQNDAVPAFFRVVDLNGIDVRSVPQRDANIVRHIAKDTVILITDRIYRGEPWLEVANNGFILDDQTIVQRMPVDETVTAYRSWSGSTATTSAQERLPGLARVSHNNWQFVSRPEPIRPFANPANSSRVLDRLQALEQNVRAMSASLNAVKESLKELIEEEVLRLDSYPHSETMEHSNEIPIPEEEHKLADAPNYVQVMSSDDGDDGDNNNDEQKTSHDQLNTSEASAIESEYEELRSPLSGMQESNGSPNDVRELRRRYFARKDSQDSSS